MAQAQQPRFWCRVALMLVCVLSGCAHLPVDPTQVSVAVSPDWPKSGHVQGEVVLIVALRNDSKRALHFPVDDLSDPPLHLDWTHYKILKNSPDGFVEDLERAPFADGVLPLGTLNIGAGDATTLRVYFEDANKADCSQRFVVQLQDKSGSVFRSKPFRPCDWRLESR